MAEKQVIVEYQVKAGLSGNEILAQAARELTGSSFRLDRGYQPVPAPADATTGEQVVIIRGTVDEARIESLKQQPGVKGVWSDARIEPFDGGQPSPPDLTF
jgi:hypothetical protein